MTTHDQHPWESRAQEAEIKVAFLERELELYKEAVQGLHARLETLERVVENLRRKIQGEGVGGNDPDADTRGGDGGAFGFSG